MNELNPDHIQVAIAEHEGWIAFYIRDRARIDNNLLMHQISLEALKIVLEQINSEIKEHA